MLGQFKGREGELVSGTDPAGQQPAHDPGEPGHGGGTAASPEQVPGEKYIHGNRLRAFVIDVHRGTKGPSITLSRSHPGLVRKLFELEVPEIADGIGRDRGAGPRSRPPHQDRREGQHPRRQRQGRLHR